MEWNMWHLIECKTTKPMWVPCLTVHLRPTRSDKRCASTTVVCRSRFAHGIRLTRVESIRKLRASFMFSHTNVCHPTDLVALEWAVDVLYICFPREINEYRSVLLAGEFSWIESLIMHQQRYISNARFTVAESRKVRHAVFLVRWCSWLDLSPRCTKSVKSAGRMRQVQQAGGSNSPESTRYRATLLSQRVFPFIANISKKLLQ